MSLDPITAGIDLATAAVARIWPDKTAKEQAELAAAVTLAQGQMTVNQAEASNPSLLVAGWRPLLGWVCGSACAWNWIGLPVAKFGAQLLGHPVDLEPADLSEMWPLLLGLVGTLGGLRTLEKVKGVA